MTFTFGYVDLPPLPDSIVESAWASVKANQGNHDIKVNNWLNLPGYVDYEYRNFTQRNGKSVRTIKTHRYNISEEFDQWVAQNLDEDVGAVGAELTPRHGVALYDDHSTFFAPHVDISRDYALMYILDTGGTQVETSWYRQKGHPLLRPDLKAVFDLDQVPQNFDDLEEIDRVCFPMHKWICINSAILHAVENVESVRVAIQISRNTPPSVAFSHMRWHSQS
jgi:hypothetical protein